MNNRIETILCGFQDWPTEGIVEWLLHDTQQKFTSTQNEQPGGLAPSNSKAFRFSIAVWHSALPTSELSLILLLLPLEHKHKHARALSELHLVLSARRSHVAGCQSLLLSMVCCWLLLIWNLAKWHSVNDMDVKAVIMGRSKRKRFLNGEATGELPNGQ